MKYKGGSSGTPMPGKTIYKMSSNENPLGTSEKVIDHVRSLAQDLYLYPDTTDIRLREALEAHYKGSIKKEQFITGNSGSQILQLLVQAFINKGDEVIVSSPYFVPYRTFCEWAGATAIDVPLSTPKYRLDVDGIAKAVTDKTRIIFITSPNNPTGTYVNKSQLERLLTLVPKDVLVIYDEVYQHFIREEDYATADTILEDHPNLVGLNSFSKAYGLASMRVGYMYSSKEIADYVRLICRPFTLNKLSMEAGISALQDTPFIDQVYHHVQKEAAFLHKGLDDRGITYIPTCANFIMFKPPINASTFVIEMTKQGVILRPLDNYMAPGWVRVSIGTREANDAFLQALNVG